MLENRKKRNSPDLKSVAIPVVAEVGLSSQLSNSPTDCSPNRATLAALLEFVSSPTIL